MFAGSSAPLNESKNFFPITQKNQSDKWIVVGGKKKRKRERCYYNLPVITIWINIVTCMLHSNSERFICHTWHDACFSLDWNKLQPPRKAMQFMSTIIVCDFVQLVFIVFNVASRTITSITWYCVDFVRL